jgi:hypothetical protein
MQFKKMVMLLLFGARKMRFKGVLSVGLMVWVCLGLIGYVSEASGQCNSDMTKTILQGGGSLPWDVYSGTRVPFPGWPGGGSRPPSGSSGYGGDWSTDYYGRVNVICEGFDIGGCCLSAAWDGWVNNATSWLAVH